jgi:PilZ domain/Thioredoxin 2, N-terminal
MSKRRFNRFKKRFDARFSSGDHKFRGISGNLSEDGIFIRSTKSFIPGSPVDIELTLNENQVSKLRGVVKWSKRIALPTVSSGMGIELKEKDRHYADLLNGLSKGSEAPDAPLMNTMMDLRYEGTIIVRCPSCKAENRVLREKMSYRPRCGKCGAVLDISEFRDTG